MPSGRECTVSLRDLAPCGDSLTNNNPDSSSDRNDLIQAPHHVTPRNENIINVPHQQSNNDVDDHALSPGNIPVADQQEKIPSPSKRTSLPPATSEQSHGTESSTPTVRRSTREKKPPCRYPETLNALPDLT